MRALRRLAVHLASLRFLRSTIPFIACVPILRSRGHSGASASGPGGSCSGYPFRLFKAWRRRDLPGSWMTLPPHLPCSRTPVESGCQAFAAPRCCPRDRYHEDLGNRNLSRLNHTASAVASYASCPGHPKATQGWLLAVGQLYQVGLVSHRVHARRFRSITVLLPPSPGLSWRQTICYVSACGVAGTLCLLQTRANLSSHPYIG